MYDNNIKQKSLHIYKFSISLLFCFILITVVKAFSQLSNIYIDPYPIRNFQVGCYPADITRADFNGDGFIDIAVCYPAMLGNSIVSVILNQKDDKEIFFSEPIIFNIGENQDSRYIVAGDFNSDGKPDIITSNNLSGDITILRNTSIEDKISFDMTPGNKVGSHPNEIYAADLNGDGFLDLGVNNVILKNTSTDSIILFQFELTSSVSNFCDFDGDGKIDLIGSSYIKRNISTIDSILFSQSYDLEYSGDFVTPADFDGDGKPDIAAMRDYFGEEIYILKNLSSLGDLNFQRVQSLKTNLSVGDGTLNDVHACDINRDGKMDLIYSVGYVLYIGMEEGEHNYVKILINNGNSGDFFSSNHEEFKFQVAEDPKCITSADFDNDGNIDIAIGCHYKSESVSVIHNKSTEDEIRLNSVSTIKIEDWSGFDGFGDFNGDHIEELISLNEEESTISFFKNLSIFDEYNFEKIGTFHSPYIQYSSFIKIIDFNNDNLLDIIAWSNNHFVFLLNESSYDYFIFNADTFDIENLLAIKSFADFDKDGKIDFVVERSSEKVELFKNIGSTDSLKFQIGWSIRGTNSLVDDFDNDGLLDIIVYPKIYHNESTPATTLFVEQTPLPLIGTLPTIEAKDFDGDNFPDLFATAGYNYGYYIIKNESQVGNIKFSIPEHHYSYNGFFMEYAKIDDLNNDGLPDVFLHNSERQFTILENKSTLDSIEFLSPFPGTIIIGDETTHIYDFAIYDLDKNGSKEILADGKISKELHVLKTSTKPFVTKVQNEFLNFPNKFYLSQNYPNPFNPSTTINFQIPVAGRVLIKIYDILGREVTTLIDNYYDAGLYSKNWNGFDNYGNMVASGVYFYKIESNNFQKTKKALLIK